MAQQKYLKANQSLGKAEINLETDDIRVILIDAADYTVNFTTHQFLSDIPGAARVATSGALANKSVSATGVFDADDIVLSAVSGDTFEAVVIYQHTGVEGTSRLISYDDTPSQLPATPNGTDVTIQWDSGANKIFAI
jgi:hypothetical protein